jgi:hypothetical protein
MKNPILLMTLIAAFAFACGGGDSTPKEAIEVNEEKVPEHAHDHDHDHGSADAPALLEIPESSRVFFANLQDSATVVNPVIVSFGLEGMEVEPAGELNQGKGHHHLIVNGEFTKLGGVVPADSTHIHYGGGQLADTLELPVGNHTLTMQFADGHHRSYGEQLSATITVTVAE